MTDSLPTEPARAIPALPALTQPPPAIPGDRAPQLDGESGFTPPSANFLQGPNGTERRGLASFKPIQFGSYGSGWGGGAYGGPWNNLAHRDRVVASNISNELAVSSSTLRTIVEVLTNATVGPDGLTLSAKVDAEEIGCTEAEAREINRQLEKRWKVFCEEPDMCDITGRFDMHSLATQVFQNFLLGGEALAFMDVARVPGVDTLTKVAMSDARIVDVTSKTLDGGGSVFNGMQFDRRGRWEGIWCRRVPVGAIVNPGALKFIPAKTRWGRPKIYHGFEQIVSGQVRGLSPLTNALGAVASRELLNELSIASHAAQLNWALTIESDAPSSVALGGLEIPEERTAMSEALGGAITELRSLWYGNAEKGVPGVHPKLGEGGGGVVSHLLPGDHLNLTQPAKLAENYAEFNRSLHLEAARAAGAAASDVTGDYSRVNFSAARMEQAQPFRTAMRRRREIVGRFYSTVYRCVVEEWIASGMISLPDSARPFWDCPRAYCRGEFLGVGVVEADKLKAAQASVLRLANGLDTLSEVLSAEGKDFDSHLAQLTRERQALKDAGLPIDYVTQSQRRITEDEEAGGNEEAPEGERKKQ
ncbi:MAG: phage portal protein [Roseiarcus sp.]|jgi:lambda family phage portal protein